MTTLKKQLAGSVETALDIPDSKAYLANLILHNKMKGDGNMIDGSILNTAYKYEISGSLSDKVNEMASDAVDRLQGVEGNFQLFTAESLKAINGEYFKTLIDASYSQDTNAPDIVAQGIGASEHRNGETFTTMELLETGQYIVEDYPSFVDNIKNQSQIHDLQVQGLPIEVDFSQELLNSLSAVNDGQALADALDDLVPDQMSFDFEA